MRAGSGRGSCLADEPVDWWRNRRDGDSIAA
jgi:hypothetical protein